MGIVSYLPLGTSPEMNRLSERRHEAREGAREKEMNDSKPP